MNNDDLRAAQSFVRGLHVAVSGVRVWADRPDAKPEDKALCKALERAATECKDWLRAKAIKLANPPQ
jgi:hypothetical protein